MKTTAFTKYHIAAGAKMAEFAGYNMPIEFSGINDEHMTVREKCGVFDVSHMGEIWVKGEKALDLLQHIASNDVAKLFDGKVQYATMPNGRGGVRMLPPVTRVMPAITRKASFPCVKISAFLMTRLSTK